MTAWSEPEKARLRKYLGYPALFKQLEPKLENAIKSVQAVADGGVLPDDSTQVEMRLALTNLAALEVQMNSLYPFAHVNQADEDKVGLDIPRAMAMYRSEGRRLISQLSIPLGTTPVRDYFSPITADPSDWGTGHGSTPFFGKSTLV